MPAKSKPTRTASATKTSASDAATNTTADAIALLTADHRAVEQMFTQFRGAKSADQKQTVAQQICRALIMHSTLEEEIFYPACRSHGVEATSLDEAQVEHDSAKILIAELLHLPPDSPYYDAKVIVLSEYIKHHVGEEEKSSDGIFAKARSGGVDMKSLGRTLQDRKRQLASRGDDAAVRAPRPRSLQQSAATQPLTEENMPRNQGQYDQERDERGRFVSDDQQRGGYSRGRYEDDDDRRYGSSSSSSTRRRDDDDDDRGSQRGRSYGSDDDREYGRGGHGGWYGDSERHAQAARGRSGRDDDDERGYRQDRDDQYGDRRQSTDRDDRGRYTSGSSNGGGYGQPSQRREYDDDRGGSGRSNTQRDEYGRFTSNDDRDRRYSSSRDDSRSRSRDDDRSSSRSGEDHGGWYGDSRRHAEAARQGWQNRR